MGFAQPYAADSVSRLVISFVAATLLGGRAPLWSVKPLGRGRTDVTVLQLVAAPVMVLLRLLVMQLLFVQVVAALFQDALSDKGDRARGAVVYATIAKSAGTGRKDGLAVLNRD